MSILKKADPDLNNIIDQLLGNDKKFEKEDPSETDESPSETDEEKSTDDEIEVGEEGLDEEGKPINGSSVTISIDEEDEEPKVFTFKLPVVPGSTIEDLEDIVVDEPEDEVEVEERDLWDWEKLDNFMPWLSNMFASVPPHSGTEISGVERAISYLENLERSISKAVKSDIKNELKIADIESARDEIHDGIERLEKRLETLNIHKKRTKKKKADVDSLLVKQAQKISGISGIVVTVPLLISRIARACINGTVSAGHDMEAMMDEQIKKYALSDREQAELLQLIEDMGYQVRRDRGYKRDEEIDLTKGKFDWNSNYTA